MSLLCVIKAFFFNQTDLDYLSRQMGRMKSAPSFMSDTNKFGEETFVFFQYRNSSNVVTLQKP